MKRTVFSLLAAFALCVSAAAAGPAVSCPSALLMEKQRFKTPAIRDFIYGVTKEF